MIGNYDLVPAARGVWRCACLLIVLRMRNKLCGIKFTLFHFDLRHESHLMAQ